MGSGKSACPGPRSGPAYRLFERLAIDVLQETDIQGATRILRTSWDEG
jgi:hypothetical protein